MSLTARIAAVLLASSVALAASAAAGAPPPETLALTDLVNHPERLPATVTLAREFNFGGGLSAKQGQSVRVMEFNGAEVGVDAGDNLFFAIAPADCDLLEAANAAWGKLTPAQRAVEPGTIIKDQSLWPATVKIAAPIGLQNGTTLPAGTEFDVVSITREGAQIASAEHDANFVATFAETDLIARARERAALDPAQRPSRIAAAIMKHAVDPEGKRAESAELEKANVYVLYFTASWCAPCRQFSPKLVRFAADSAAENPKMSVVLISQDEEDGKFHAYQKESRLLWPAVPLAALRKSHVLSAYAGRSIPQLVVIDRHGKVLADSFVPGRYIAPDAVLKNLSALLQTGAAR